MDHWKESAITNKGNELLNEMMAGRNFVLTRAIGGSGLVEASELAGQTALVNPKQQLSIVEERTDSAGKNIEIQVFNKGVTEEYPIQQVGVYGKLEGDEKARGTSCSACFALLKLSILEDSRSILILRESPAMIM